MTILLSILLVLMLLSMSSRDRRMVDKLEKDYFMDEDKGEHK